MLLASQILVIHVKSMLQCVWNGIEVHNDFESHRQKDHASDAVEFHLERDSSLHETAANRCHFNHRVA